MGLLKNKILALSLAAFAVVACGEDNDVQEISDETPQGNEQPTQFPSATGDWREARIFKIDDESDSGDQGQCGQTDLRVNREGVWTSQRCDRNRSGQLTADEFRQLDQLVVDAYQSTSIMACPEVFRFGQYYTYIDSNNDQNDRTFDPDDACYSGDDDAAESLENYMRQLSSRYATAASQVGM